MNISKLSWQNLISNPLNTVLSLLLMTFGVGIISLLFLLNNQIEQQLQANLRGVDMVVGSKGSPLQLILSSIYHIDNPTGNISLPEVKRGIFPLQVMQSISSIIGLKKTIDWCIRGYKINAEIAKEWGLVDEICNKENIENSAKKWIEDFSGNSNKAIEFGLKAFQEHFHKNSNHEKLEKLFRDMIENNHLSDEF